MSEYGILDSSFFVWTIILAIAWWIAGSFGVSKAASKRGMDSGNWLFLSLALGPILTALLLLAHPAQPVLDEDESTSFL